eukprot:NODE_753_length_785_cov_690.297554_g575_i0.p1 GENE.NODE_753_length_785_cov_690.297554_g575_i0~~NODE_753_length_785_cov_690.297554_g575_i0.p1  ORF type:complete len:125 (-),score=6.86 NODE_753_length_785_cov_690.297554_g575_i0:115-489(-)
MAQQMEAEQIDHSQPFTHVGEWLPDSGHLYRKRLQSPYNAYTNQWLPATKHTMNFNQPGAIIQRISATCRLNNGTVTILHMAHQNDDFYIAVRHRTLADKIDVFTGSTATVKEVSLIVDFTSSE